MLLTKFSSCFLSILIILSDIEESTIGVHIFIFQSAKINLTGLFTSQPIAVVALSTAPVCRLRAPSAGAPAVCPLDLHPAAPQQLPLACQAASSHERARLASCPALPYTSITR